MKKLVLVLAAALLVAVGALLLQLADAGPRSARVPAAPDEAETPTAAPAVELVAAPVLDEPGHAAVQPASARSALAQAGDQESFDLDGASWVDVSVALPGPIPADDQPFLLGFTTPSDLNEWNVHRIGEQLDLTDAFAEKLEEGACWSRRPLQPSLRLPFRAGAKEAVLLLQSRYLVLEPVRFALPTSEPLAIAPVLGAYVTGRCVLPQGSKGRGIEASAIELEFDGRPREGGMMALREMESRDARVRDDLTFELRALSPDRKYSVQARCEGLVGYFQISLEVQPGEHRELEIPFRLGATVRGRVLGPDRAPLAGADVSRVGRPMMVWGSDAKVQSDAEGRFELLGVPEGKAALLAQKPGWLEARSEPFEAVDGGVIDGIDIVLGAGGHIAGSVLWPDGVAAKEAEVEAYVQRGQRSLDEVASTRTDAEGRFELGGLAAGPFEVYAMCLPATADEPRLGVAPATDENEDVARGRWMAIESGVTEGAELVLRLERPIELSGTVADDTGAVVNSFRIEAGPSARERGGPDSVSAAIDDEAGAFRIGVFYPGEWRVSVSADGYTPPEAALVRVPQFEPLRLVLTRASDVTGMVVDPSGSPVAGASVSIDHPGEPLRFRNDMDGLSDDRGHFTLENVTGASVSLVARHTDWAASEPVAVDLAPGTSRADVLLHLRSGGRVTGEVFDAQGRAEAGQNVSLGGMFFGFGGEQATTTDGSGRFAFEHVTPGKITVTAMPTEEELFERMQTIEDESEMLGVLGNMRSATVEVLDGQTAHVVLGAKPVKPVRVHGRVTEASRALEGVSVLAIAEGGTIFQGMKMSKTEADGRYELVLDRPGDYSFGVNTSGEAFGGVGVQFPVDVPEVEELEQDLALPLANVAGRVFGPDGEPAAGVPLRLTRADGLLGLDDLDDASWISSQGDGSFAFGHLHPGRYTLYAGGSAARFGQLAESSGTAIVGGIEVRGSRGVDGLRVHLEGPGKLAGRVLDEAGEPVAGAAIYVRDARGLGSNVTSCLSDASGRFVFDGVPPGTATALARTSSVASAESAPIEIRAGETSSVELVLSGGTFLVVSLLDGDEPVRARLMVVDEAGRRVDDLFSLNDLEQLIGEGLSSRERRVGPLAPGKYTCSAVTTDGKDAKKSVQVEAGQGERHVKLRLK